MKYLPFLCLVLASCADPAPAPVHPPPSPEVRSEAPAPPPASPDTILARKEVPVLCYHDLKDWPCNLSAVNQAYYVPPAKFRAQMQLLKDSGYQTVSMGQYLEYLERGTPLPPKPVIITFDDGDREQFSIGAAELEKHGFKGTFFLMTIVLGKKNYLQREEVKELSRKGHEIGLHTWDHSRVTQYSDSDWVKQVAVPKKALEELTGKTVEVFAYPFGLWNGEAPPRLKEAGLKAAFQLSASRRDSLLPLYSLRRMIVHGSWDAPKMLKWMKVNFPGR